MRALAKKLELSTYQNDKFVVLILYKQLGGAISTSVMIPLPIMYRFYHIGRAYDLHQLKNLHPDGGKMVFDFIDIQLLIQEVEQICDLIADPVIRHYATILIPYLKLSSSETKWILAIEVL
jgi:cyanate lyase